MRHRFAMLLIGFSVLVSGFWGLGVLTEHRFPPESASVDGALTRWASGMVANSETFRSVPRVVTEFGGGVVTIPLAVGIGLMWLWKRGRWDGVWLLAVSIGGSTGAKALVKWLVARPRPAVAPLVEVSGSSFPSGHAVRAVALYGALAFLASGIWRSPVVRQILWLAAALLVVVIAGSRVFLGVHYLTDVIAGIALGSAWLALVIASDG